MDDVVLVVAGVGAALIAITVILSATGNNRARPVDPLVPEEGPVEPETPPEPSPPTRGKAVSTAPRPAPKLPTAPKRTTTFEVVGSGASRVP